MNIKPINQARKDQVICATRQCIRHAENIFQQDLLSVPVEFKLKGKAAGKYCNRGGRRVIYYNPYVFAKYFDDNLENTVPHEVGHYINDVLNGIGKVRPHGKEWIDIMNKLGAVPTVTNRYDLTGIPLKQQRRFQYRCTCSSHMISAVRHNRARSGEMRYYCKQCSTVLFFTGE